MTTTQEKAEQTKGYIQEYYKNLHTNYLSNILTFDARRKPEGKVRTLEVNLPKGMISYRSASSSKRAGIHLSEVFHIIKSKTNNKKVKVIWMPPASGDTVKKEKNVYFLSSMEKRECFCEIVFLGHLGVKTITNELSPSSPITSTSTNPAARVRSGSYSPAMGTIDSSPSATSPPTTRGRSGTSYTPPTFSPVTSKRNINASAIPTNEHITVFAGTWNMGNAPAQGLEDWLTQGGTHDIYAIGVQECQYQPRQGYSSCEEDWFSVLQSQLGNDYVKVAGVSLQSIRLSVHCRKEHEHKIQNIKRSTEATGIAHVYGNKGGVAIACEFYGMKLCFVAAHFAAHQENSAIRNSNYYEILEGVNLGKNQQDILNCFDHVIWFGDLNYRIDLFKEEVSPLLTYGNFERVLEADQLLKERAKQQVFIGWSEAPIKFAPTYKYCIGSRVYTDERNRVPSWCDRVLWKSLPGADPLENLNYNCYDKLMSSDHSPVFAIFNMNIPLPNYGRFVQTHSSLSSQPCKIILSDLKASNLSEPGTSRDSVLEIRGRPYVEGVVRSTVIPKTLNPVWNEPLEIQTLVSSNTYLQCQHLVVDLCVDENPIGSGVIALRGAFGTDAVPFTSDMTKYGRVTGIISGTVKVIYSSQD